MARTIISTAADEGSPYFIRVSFATEDGSAVTPNSASYSLYDADGNIVGSLSGVELSGLATSVDILISGADMYISASAASGQTRVLTLNYTYDSTLASGLSAYAEAEFTIDDFVGVI